MPKLRKIKDPLYGYIYYSEFEEKIISHPLVLRLHHIRQNGAAYLTYPSMRVHRFEHSLGAMHVAGLLFKSAVEFSDESSVDQCLCDIILGVIGKNIDEILEEIQKSSNKTGLEFLRYDNFYKYSCLTHIDEPNNFARLLMFQSVRIAALVHDIGHPPFSHTFETALKQVKQSSYSSHEIVGLELLRLIVDDIWKAENGCRYFFAKAVLKLVTAIIDKNSSENWRVIALSEIISGDVDADRLDYVRRDTLSSGSSTNAYDLGRLIDAVRFKADSSKNGQILNPIMTTDALSTVEAFFTVRFHLYRWMLWHHNVIRQNLALILLIKQVVHLAECESILSDQVNEILALALDPNRRREYWYFTDFYLLDKLSKMLAQFQAGSVSIPKDAEGDHFRLLYRYLRTFLYREKHHLRPLWKRPDNYVEFGRHVTGVKIDTDGAKALNDSLKASYEKCVKNVAKREGVNITDTVLFKKFQAEKAEYLSGIFCDLLERHLSTDLEKLGVQVRAYYLSKFKPAPKGLKLHDRDGEWNQGFDIGVLSPSIKALDEAWQGLPHLWLFVEKLPSVGITSLSEGDPKCSDLYLPAGESLKRFLASTVEVAA